MKEYSNVNLEKGIFLGVGKIDLKSGYMGTQLDMRMTNKREDIYLDWQKLSGHMLINGDDYNDKTSLMLSMLKQSISKGNNVVFINNGKKNLSNIVYDFAIKSGRQEDLEYISPFDKNSTISFNPLFGLNNEEISSLISILIPAKDDFQIVIGYTITLSILTALEFIEKSKGKSSFVKRKNITFKDILNISKRNYLKILLEEVTAIDTDDNELNNLKCEAQRSLKENLDKKEGYYETISKSFKEILNFLSIDLFSNKTENNLINEKNKILIIEMDSLEKKYETDAFFKTIINVFSSFYSKRHITKDISLFIPDAEDILFPGIEILYNKGGGKGLKMILASSKRNKPIGKEREIDKVIKDNTFTTINIEQNHFAFNKDDKKYSVKVNDQEKSNYIIDYRDFNSTEINDIYSKFCELVPEKSYQEIIKKGLADIINYRFDKDASFLFSNNSVPAIKRINLRENEYFLELEKRLGLEFVHLEVSLKRHILNNIQISLNKFEDINEDSWKKEMTPALISSFFSYFNQSVDLNNRYERESNNRFFKKDDVLIDYLDNIILDEKLLNEIKYITLNQFNQKNKFKKDKRISFLLTTEIKSRQIELLLQEEGLSKNKLSNFKKMIESENEKKEDVKVNHNTNLGLKENTISISGNILKIYTKDESSLQIVKIKKISNMHFSKRTDSSDFLRGYINLDNGKMITLDLIKEKTKKDLIELIENT